EYFIADNLGIEVLAALPFEHDIALRGLGRVGSTKHLPPVISLQYHFNSQGRLSPFVGAGINYTRFFSTDTRGALAGSELELDDSWGLALHAGVDYKLSDRG
ncbi:MAG: OmpW family protein, partial [Xanthomonas euvesicatoria]|nr:OmpW family protein [Xanthomonas euvesicatoria]